jgi:hypothetical protein
MSQLSAKDLEFISELKEAEVFQPIKGHLIDQSKGVILVTCSDGDRFPEIFQHQVRLQADCRPDPRIHVLAWHGGALACATCSPVNRRKGAHKVFLDQIKDAREWKNIDTVVLEAHGPCGAAGFFGVSLEQCLALQIGAKKNVRRLNKGIQVSCFFPVFDGEKQKTFFFSREKWEPWAQKRGIRAIA